MSSGIFYHNPRCSKSRAALALLNEREIEPSIRRYLEEPLSAEEISELLACLNLTAKEVLRSGESIYRELNLANATDEQIIKAISEHPILLERPIFRLDKQAVIGRPPERVLELLP